MKLRRSMPLLLAFLLAGTHLSATLAQDDPIESFRTWKDRTGKYEIEAELVRYERSIVELKKTDGSVIQVPLKDLSNADKWFVRKQLKQLKARGNAQKPVLQVKQPVAEKEKVEKKDNIRLAKNLDTKKMYGIEWHQTPESLQAVADSSKSQKPVMWFRVLGDLEGYM